MLRWGELLDRLADDGVTLETAEYDTLTQSGERFTTQFLQRWVADKPLTYVVEIESREDPVPKYEVRRIAIRLELDPEQYIFPDSPL